MRLVLYNSNASRDPSTESYWMWCQHFLMQHSTWMLKPELLFRDFLTGEVIEGAGGNADGLAQALRNFEAAPMPATSGNDVDHMARARAWLAVFDAFVPEERV